MRIKLFFNVFQKIFPVKLILFLPRRAGTLAKVSSPGGAAGRQRENRRLLPIRRLKGAVLFLQRDVPLVLQ